MAIDRNDCARGHVAEEAVRRPGSMWASRRRGAGPVQALGLALMSTVLLHAAPAAAQWGAESGASCYDGLDNDVTDWSLPPSTPPQFDCGDAVSCTRECNACYDGNDTNLDGRVGCADPFCAATSPYCVATFCAEGDPDCAPDSCTDGIDNDGTGLIDCDDPGCACRPECTCDATDPDCFKATSTPSGQTFCPTPGMSTQNAACRCSPECIEAATGGTGKEICDDPYGYDEDCDNLSGCADPDCVGHPACSPPSPYTCPDDAGTPCDSPADGDKCAEGVVQCDASNVGTCVGDGPLAVWMMDEGYGAVAHDMANDAGAHDAGLVGNAGWAMGRKGFGLRFTGKGPIKIPLDGTGTHYTWELWFQLDSNYTTENLTLLSHADPDDVGFLRINVSGGSVLANMGGLLLSGFLPQKTGFHHVVVTLDRATDADSGVAALYVDGEQKSTFPFSSTVPTLGFLFLGGPPPGFLTHFVGVLDQVAFYTHVLSAEQVAANFSGGGPDPKVLTREVCDGKDNNCDGQTDEFFPEKGTTCDGAADLDLCAQGVFTCAGSTLGTVCDESTALGHWPGDDQSLRAVDVSGKGNDGALLGGVVIGPGKVHQAFDFTTTGTGRKVMIGDVDLLANHQAATWVAWIRPSAFVAQESGILTTNGVHSPGQDRTWAFGTAGKGLFLRVRRTGDSSAIPLTRTCDTASGCPELLVGGTWTHVAAVYDSTGGVGVVRFYADGELVKTFQVSGGQIRAKHPDERLVIGADTTGDLESFRGSIDDVRVYGAALTASNIREIFNRTQGRERCDKTDDDCDGATDEDYPKLGTACDGPDSDQCANGTSVCSATGWGVDCAETLIDIPEVCDGVDNDCDGETDEAFPLKGTPCDGADPDQCAEGTFSCSADGTSLVCKNDGPLGLWRMHEGAGATAHDVAHDPPATHDMTLNGVVWTEGYSGKGLSFDGLTAEGTLPAVVSGTMSLELRVLPTAPGYVYSQGTLLLTGMGGFWAGGTFTHYHFDGTQVVALSGSMSADSWHHVAVVMQPGTGGKIALYIDGSAVGQAALPSNTPPGSEIRFGRALFELGFFAGVVDEVALYGFPLTPEQVAAHAASGIPLSYDNREICDGRDNDCDGTVDELPGGVADEPCDSPLDADLCATGTWTCRPDRMDVQCVNEKDPDRVERCDPQGEDENCNGQSNEGFLYDGAAIGSACVGPGACAVPGVVECIGPNEAGCSTGPGGSDYSGGGELCNGKDDDCNGFTDEDPGGGPLTAPCYTGPAGTENNGICKAGKKACKAAEWGPCSGQVLPKPVDGQCDGIDDDCDGVTDEDSHDEVGCTVDQCVGGIVVGTPDDSLCSDQNPCTDDRCDVPGPGSGCSHTPNDANVPDASVFGVHPCRKPVCEGGKVVQVDDPDAVPDDHLECTADKCLFGQEVHVVTDGWCLIDGVCYTAGAVNAENACRVCQPQFDANQWTSVVHFGDFDQGGGILDGYTVEELVNGAITWNQSPVRSLTGGFSLYFGDGAVQSYGSSGQHVKAAATSAKVRLPAGVRLEGSFWVFMETEGYTGSDKFDTLTVDVLDVDTGESSRLWDSMSTLASDTHGEFRRVGFDLSPWAGQEVQLRFTFDSGDAYFNDYEGVYIDKIRIETGCCFSVNDCDDQNACTTESCESKQCVHKKICGECQPRQTSVVFLLGRSSSMASTLPTGKTRWDAVTDAVDQVVASYDQDTNLGFKLLPSVGQTGCALDPFLDLDFHVSADAVSEYMGAAAPGGLLPLGAALTEALTAFTADATTSEKGNKFVILVVDGTETCGGDPLAAIKALRNAGVFTLVVAFDAQLTQSQKEALNAMAMAGGLPRPRTTAGGPVYFAVDPGGDMNAALTAAFDLSRADLCNGADDNCDGSADGQAPKVACNLTCNGGLGGQRLCQGGQYGICSEQVITEQCDGVDNDCDGLIDEDWPELGKPCTYGEGACQTTGTYACPPGQLGAAVCVGETVGAKPEVCNGLDDDCNGDTDEGLSRECTTACGAGTELCKNGVYTGCTAAVAQLEVCNGVDDDCNGAVDDIVPIPCTGACSALAWSEHTTTCAGDFDSKSPWVVSSQVSSVWCAIGLVHSQLGAGKLEESYTLPAGIYRASWRIRPHQKGFGFRDVVASVTSATGCLKAVENLTWPIADQNTFFEANPTAGYNVLESQPLVVQSSDCTITVTLRTETTGNTVYRFDGLRLHENVGQGGFQECVDGEIGPCSDASSPEVCNGKDDDCDGLTDEDDDGSPLTAPCTPDTPLKGDCAKGTQVCANGVLEACVPLASPTPEVCNGKDDDCDGLVDNTTDGVPVSVPCYDGPPGTLAVGDCVAGVRSCQGDGTLSACTGQITPIDELCDGKDNDCDGVTDENPGQICSGEPGCGPGFCLCQSDGGGNYKCFLD